MTKRQTRCCLFKRHDHLVASIVLQVKMIALNALRIVPYCVQYGGLYLCANQWRALVQENGAVFCLQQLRAGGCQALVGELVDFLSASVIQSQTNIGVALALKD